MNRGRRVFLLVLAAGVLASGSLIAFAQSGGPPGPRFREHPEGDMLFMRPASSPQEICLDIQARHAGALAFLKARLELTQQQYGIWQELETALASLREDERLSCSHLPTNFDAIEVPQVVKIAEEQLALRLRQLQKAAPIVSRLYEALSADQRKVLNRLIPRPPAP